MLVREAERLCLGFLARADEAEPKRKVAGQWKVRRPMGDADAAALDAVMEALLPLGMVRLLHLAGRLGIELGRGRQCKQCKTPNTIHERWCIFSYLKRELLLRRRLNGTSSDEA